MRPRYGRRGIRPGLTAVLEQIAAEHRRNEAALAGIRRGLPVFAPGWAEGSRAIEARREASKMRHVAYGKWEYRRFLLNVNLYGMMYALGIDRPVE